MRTGKIKFTKHASEKLKLLETHGFPIPESIINKAVKNPDHMERRNEQTLAIKAIDEEFALRVVFKQTNDNIPFVTFYPVKRARYGV